MFIGDRWCDAQNNREHCNWDGGDCCPSTTPGGMVRTIEDCAGACTCTDPDAVENKLADEYNRKLKAQRLKMSVTDFYHSVLSKSRARQRALMALRKKLFKA